VLALLIRVERLHEEQIRLRVVDQAGQTLIVVRGSGEVVFPNNGGGR